MNKISFLGIILSLYAVQSTNTLLCTNCKYPYREDKEKIKIKHCIIQDNSRIEIECKENNVCISSSETIENATVTISKNGNIVDTNTNVNITSYSEIPYDVTQYGQGEYTITVSKDTTVLYVVNIIVE